jgi:crotonobetainyl-CoA:carnitine CoA-transferase CaiB-like acyl-CoA transferase
MALVQRERTGVGQYIEVGQRNLLVGLIGEAIVAEQLGQEPIRRGNRSRVIAPQGAYACRRDDGVDEADAWLALSVVTDGQWSSLCQTIGRPELADQYPDVVSRQAAHDAIDEAITAWTQTVDARTAADTLQAAGIPASPVLTPAGLRDDPQLTARGFLRTVKHPTMGDMNLTAPTWHIRGIDRELIAAPGLGEHNHYVLKEFLDYSDEQIAELEAAGVIATRPRGV